MTDVTAPDAPPTLRKSRLRGSLSIQSKLLVMLLGVSLASSIIVGAIGFINGRQSLQDSAVNQLVSIRELRAAEITTEIDGVRKNIALQSRNLSAQQMSIAINAGYDSLADLQLTAEQGAELEAYYAGTFIPMLQERSGIEFGDTALIPESNAGKWLQLNFTTANKDFDADYDAMLLDNNLGDGSDYSIAAERYGDYFSRLIDGAGYEDALLLNLDGDVVFSAYKGAELGTNLDTGQYRDTPLADAFRAAISTNSVSSVQITDFNRWIPSLNKPTMWAVSPIGNDSGLTGALAVQISTERVNSVMTGNQSWAKQGLGETGEAYLVGRDHLMRSNSRKLVDNPDIYEEKLANVGVAPSVAERIVRVGGTVLLQPVETYAVRQALSGRDGSIVGPDYIGDQSLTAYAPLQIEGLDWVIVARIDTAESFAPVNDFTRIVSLTLLGILLAVSLLSLLLAQVFTRPIHRLVGAVRKIAGGDLNAQVPQVSRDEFGDLANAFNDMASSLRIKQELIEGQQQENEKLLLTLMPESVANKYKQGQETISEAHENVSVVFAELVGFTEYVSGLSTEQEIGYLNTLMRGFDEAAQRSGVEKVRTLHGGYLASSGLSIPRVDNVRRSVEFARNLVVVVERFNMQHGASLSLRAGVDTGTVTSGLVGRTSLAYDLWGDAVSLAYRVRSVTGEPGIYVSQTVRDRTQEFVNYVEAGTVDSQGQPETVWKVA